MSETSAPAPTPSLEETTPAPAHENVAAEMPAVEPEHSQPARRAPARGRRRAASPAAEPTPSEMQPAELITTEPPVLEPPPGETAEEPAQPRRPAARRRSNRVARAAEPSVAAEEAQETSPAVETAPATVDMTLAAVEPAPEPELVGGEEELDLTARVLPMRRGPRHERGPVQEEPASPSISGLSGPAPAESRAQPYEYEPLPPPTKRKAPRNGTRATNRAPTENAVDWALGRSSAIGEENVTVEPPAAGGRRRRSRRGRRGGGGLGAQAVAEEALGQRQPAPAAEVERNGALRVPQTPAPQPSREERTRSQLSTLEQLVARQNVVLDQLLARVASFASIERALLAIERRLASQVGGAAGAATPRVGIFVDVPNIVYAAERIGVTIDFGKLLHFLTRGRELVRASAYAPISDDPLARLDTQKFVQPFVHRGYRIVTKPLKRFSDGTMKGNFDVELAMDILTMSERLDIVSLVSGDGDFSRLVEIVGSKGLRVEVVAFGASTSADLRAICDDYIDLQDHLDELT